MSLPIADPPGLRGRLQVPNWFANRLGKNVGFRVLWVIALICDAFIQAAIEGFRAALPGVGTDTALPYIGYGRGIIQGRAESNASYAARLANYRATWAKAGSAAGLAAQLQSYLGGATVVRIIDRSGLFVTCDATGAITFATDATWNWDGSSTNPQGWSDIWIVVYPDPAYGVYTSLTDPAWLAAWGVTSGNQPGIGQKVLQDQVGAILQIVRTWKGAHTYVQAIIWSTDTTLFVPGSLGAAGNPDGTWGNWCYGKTSAPSVVKRTLHTSNGDVRYWEPEIAA